MLVVRELELLTGKKVSLSLQRGKRYVLQGPNGSGKTVLLRTLAGLYPAAFKEFTFDGKSLDDRAMEDYRTKVLYSGTATHLPGGMTAEDFLASPFRLSVYSGMKSSFPVGAYLSKWNLTGKTLSHLSSGQKQLLIFLRAMSLRAEILLLDEPTSHLDSERTREVEELLAAWTTPEKTYLVISHSEAQAVRLGEKINFSDIVF